MAEHYRVIENKLVRMIEVCTGCKHNPQAPVYDQCFGCGKTGYEVKRELVPANG